MRLLTLHDILVAWRDGEIDYRRAMEMARIDTLGELHDAAESSGVEPRMEPHDCEVRQAEVIADVIRGQASSGRHDRKGPSN